MFVFSFVCFVYVFAGFDVNWFATMSMGLMYWSFALICYRMVMELKSRSPF